MLHNPPQGFGMTISIQQFLKFAAAELAAGSKTARVDAETLLMHVLGITRGALITRASEMLRAGDEQRLQELLTRRRRGEPVAYLTGTREFWSLALRVTPATLIPRPETELLVEQALARLPAETEWTIADLGTGSGAIALALARERPHWRVFATDISDAALAVARENAQRLGLSQVEWRLGSWIAPLADEIFDLIVSNPPYVADADPHLSQGDVRFEPRLALAAGLDGLDALREIMQAARTALKPGGWLLLEHGFNQAPAVRTALMKSGYRDIVGHRDLSGNNRVTAARAPG
jgi:release factor glutamine methyltransferase